MIIPVTLAKEIAGFFFNFIHSLCKIHDAQLNEWAVISKNISCHDQFIIKYTLGFINNKLPKRNYFREVKQGNIPFMILLSDILLISLLEILFT